MKINLDYTVLETCRDFCIAASITAKHSSISSSCDELCGYAELHPSHPLPIPWSHVLSSPLSPDLAASRPPGPGLGLRNAGQPRLHRPPAPAGDRGRRLEARMAQGEPRPRLDRRRRPTRSPPTARCRGPVNDSGPGRASIATAGPRRRRLGLRHDRRQRPAAAGRRTTRGPAAPRSPPPARGGGLARGGGPATLLRAGGRLGIWLDRRY